MRARTGMRLPLLLAALLLAGCLEPSDGDGPAVTSPATTTPTVTTPQTPDGALAIQTLGAGQQSGVRESARRVVTDAETFAPLWNETREDGSPPPEVDFATSTVLAVYLGQKPNACWSVRVTNASASAGAARVEVTTYAAPPDMACASVVTYPWHVVVVDAPDLQVDWVETQATYPPR